MHKKIYLIDDDQDEQRSKYYQAGHVVDGRYADTLVNIQRILPKEQEALLKKLQTAAAVLIHKTFPDFNDSGHARSQTNFSQYLITELERKIPLCVFTYSMQHFIFDAAKNPNYVPQLNKRLFYAHLEDFIKHYEKERVIDFRVLVQGKHFKAQAAKPYYTTIYQKLIQQPPHILFDPLTVYDALENFYAQTSSTKNFEDFVFDLTDHPISTASFLTLLNKMYNSLLRYGKNIHH